MKDIIYVSGISKRYETLDLKDISFKIKKGSIVAVLGANGSGKTTLLRMLSTNIKPDLGTIKYSLSKKEETISDIRGKLGVLFETPSLYGCMTILENLNLFADIYNIRHKNKQELLRASLDLSGIYDRKDCIVDSLSYGLRRRADISRAFINNPDIIILDEPFKGLDTRTISDLKEKFKEYSKLGKTIIFSTNDYMDAEDIANYAVLLEDNNFYFDTTDKIQIKLLSKNR